MHPRNRFKHYKPDFGEYLKTHKPLEPYLIKRSHVKEDGLAYTLDFSDPHALRELTRASLAHEFGLQVTIPPDRLVPTLPQRLNYIHWIEDLISDGKGDFPKSPVVTGIDIGTGSTCIYPLLAVKLNNWTFIATEVDKESYQCAKNNVAANKMADNISVSPDDPILRGVVKDDGKTYTFCMCNPPFFKDQEDKTGFTSSRSARRPVPVTQNTGNETETITEGGEAAFVGRIVEDSLKLKERIRWYTSMVGKKSTLKQVKALLETNKVPVVSTTEFIQGKTHRWGIAWSFTESLKPKVVMTGAKRPHPLQMVLKDVKATSEGITKAFVCVQKILTELKMHIEIVKDGSTMMCTATINTWSHQRKRKRLKQQLKDLLKKDYKSSQPADISESKQRPSEKDINEQLEALNVSCYVKFTCSVSLAETEEDGKGDKRSMGETDEREPQQVLLCLEYLEGSERDHVHQLMQYIHNSITL